MMECTLTLNVDVKDSLLRYFNAIQVFDARRDVDAADRVKTKDESGGQCRENGQADKSGRGG